MASWGAQGKLTRQASVGSKNETLDVATKEKKSRGRARGNIPLIGLLLKVD